MQTLLQPCHAWAKLESEHCRWLLAFAPQHLQKWENLRNEDYEAALCEAAVRRLLQAHGITVEPNEDLVGKAPAGTEARPDFRCSRPEGAFFVEATCISIVTVVKQTGLPHPLQPVAQSYGNLNHAIFGKSFKKYRQCSETNLPTLLAVGTFHQSSALLMSRKFADMLLTGKPSLSWTVDTETGPGIGEVFQTTGLRSAPFLKPGSLGGARTSLSGLLLCGFGYSSPYVLGILHPCAARPFDRRLLPGIPFGEVLINQATGQLCTYWPGETERTGSANIEGFLA